MSGSTEYLHVLLSYQLCFHCRGKQGNITNEHPALYYSCDSLYWFLRSNHVFFFGGCVLETGSYRAENQSCLSFFVSTVPMFSATHFCCCSPFSLRFSVFCTSCFRCNFPQCVCSLYGFCPQGPPYIIFSSNDSAVKQQDQYKQLQTSLYTGGH